MASRVTATSKAPDRFEDCFIVDSSFELISRYLSERACASMRSEVIPDHLPILHHKSNSLQLGNIGDRISRNGDEIGKFPGLNRAHAVLPAQHFCGAGGHRANDIERRHSGVMQIGKYCGTGLAPRFS